VDVNHGRRLRVECGADLRSCRRSCQWSAADLDGARAREPRDDSPEHTDIETVNRLLAVVEARLKLASAFLLTLDRSVGMASRGLLVPTRSTLFG
jgi:hypothetical protein